MINFTTYRERFLNKYLQAQVPKGKVQRKKKVKKEDDKEKPSKRTIKKPPQQYSGSRALVATDSKDL